jgi:hypothetical protein
VQDIDPDAVVADKAFDADELRQNIARFATFLWLT